MIAMTLLPKEVIRVETLQLVMPKLKLYLYRKLKMLIMLLEQEISKLPLNSKLWNQLKPKLTLMVKR